ncbi:hypothetical protein Psuf_029180 [Phytohabitans suffuscus]|uniref:Uncharacterized protein n=1 Tax=Phytohabitans suffuscus TaxID=624315 RepID=A0A6F8YHK3_9ACTN|nr:hypothetical protein Psuf_029180 [Phytohabitans suffuscus]
MHEQRLAAEQAESLGTAGTEPHSGAGRRNEDRDVTARIELRGHVAVPVEKL